MIKNKYLYLTILFSALIGMTIYFLVFGFNEFNPLNIDILYKSGGDLTQNYIGWKNFRNSPWEFPFGLYDSLSYPEKVSILWTGSMPLFAIFFKLFSKILPENFQYFGIYTFMCYTLQTTIGAILIKKFQPDSLIGALNSIFSGILFILVPFIFSFAYSHVLSCSHWLILASLIPFVYNKEFKHKQKLIYFSIISFVASGIDIYISAICGFLSIFLSIYDFSKNKNKLIFLCPILYIFFALLMLYISGAFVGLFEYQSNMFPYAQLNLNAFYNPTNPSSSILPKLEVFHSFQCFSMAYFGCGIFLLIFIAGLTFIINFLKKKEQLSDKKLIFCFIIVFLFSLIIALSPKITFNEKIIFEYKIPDFIYSIWSSFSLTGRFIYMGYYLIILIPIIYLSTKIKPYVLTILLLFFIGVQIYDIKGYIISAKYPDYEERRHRFLPEFDKKLEKIDKNKFNLIYIEDLIYIGIESSYSIPTYNIAKWAYENNYKLANFVFARKIKNKKLEYKNTLLNPKENELFFFDFPILNETKEGLLKKNLNIYNLETYGIYLASKEEILGLKKYKISKEKLLKEIK